MWLWCVDVSANNESVLAIVDMVLSQWLLLWYARYAIYFYY